MRKIAKKLLVGAILLAAGLAVTLFFYPKPYPTKIPGKIITLKKLTLGDAGAYLAALSADVRKSVEFPEEISSEYINEHIRIKFEKMEKGLKIAYTIWDNRDKKLIGAIEIRKKRPDDPEQPGQFEIWLHEDYRGHGRAQEAMYLISRAYFDANPTTNKYDAYVRPWNTRSRRALEKFGFIHVHDLVEDDEITDHVLEFYRDVIEEKQRTK